MDGGRVRGKSLRTDGATEEGGVVGGEKRRLEGRRRRPANGLYPMSKCISLDGVALARAPTTGVPNIAAWQAWVEHGHQFLRWASGVYALH